MDNKHTTWVQGRFIDSELFDRWTLEEKRRAREIEALRVRPSPKGNMLCQCPTPEAAAWVAGRLNLAAVLEARLKKEEE